MEKERIDLEQEDSRHTNKMCSMCQMCPCMQHNPNMMGMYQQQMQQPMMGQMCDSNGRNEYEDYDDFGEDDFRRRHGHNGRNRYIWNPFLWMWVLRP